MKRLLTIFFVFLINLSFFGCGTKENLFSVKQQKAIDDSVKYLDNFTFSSEEGVNSDIIQIKNATESTWKLVSTLDDTIDENDVDVNDWVITIGDTSKVDYAIIVYDCETEKVIGYIPNMLQKAIDNCIKYLDNFTFSSKEGVDTDIIEISKASNNSWEYVWTLEGRLKKNEVDENDWIITIGDISVKNDFACIVCDSETGIVIGFEPIM